MVVQLLTNVSIYWYNAAITSSMRLYYETMGPFAKPNNRFDGYVRVRPLPLPLAACCALL